MPARSVKSSGASQYEYDSQWSGDDDDYGSDGSESDYGDDVSRRTSSMSTYSGTDDAEAYLSQAQACMKKLEDLHSQQSGYWKRALKHKSGCVVYVSKEKLEAGKKGGKGNKTYQAPVFKGEHIIKGFTPAAVFGVVGTRKLWDEWYKEGNLVENLSDTSSLTYMCMKGIAGSSTRDLSLVEIVSGSVTGTIMFASTSVTTPKVPRVSGRVRANIALNGWVLEPVDNGTRVSYYLHVNVKTFVPAFAAQKYLARRPTCIARIDEYLQSHGPPPMAGVDASSGQGGGAGMRRRDSFSSQRSRRSTRSSSAGSAVGGGALIAHVATNTEASSYGDIQKASKQFNSLLSKGDWQLMLDHEGNKIFIKDGEGEIPAGKGEHILENVTTEQVLGTLLNGAARKVWDSRYASSKLVESDNGFDQGVYVETHKAVFPHLGQHYYVIARAVEREDAGSDNGQITLLSKSTKKSADGPKGAKPGHLEISGWLIEEHSDREVKVSHVRELDPEEDKIAPIVKKILPTEFARGPIALNEFIDKYGYAPFFIRWGEGPATLVSDDDGDIREGKVIYQIGGEGKGTMKDGQQKCWFQWSEKMYERGIDIKIEPADAAELAKVDGVERTLEVVWTDKVKKGATMTVKRATKGNGADDVYVGGKFLDKTVTPEKGVGGGGMKRSAPPKKQQRSADNDDASKNRNNDDGDANQAKSDKSGGGKFAPVAAAAAAGGAVAAGASRLTKPLQPASANTSRDVGGNNQGGEGAGAQQATKGGPFPNDACLIISNDLYFTRSQVMFMGVVMAAAFLYGKFA